MKKNIFLFLAIFPMTGFSQSIIDNHEVDLCVQKFNDENSECLENISDKSEEKLREAYSAKLKELKNFDYNQWWMGTREQKDNMLNLFKKNQQNWLTYRYDYCGLATTATQNTHGFANAITACTINLNNQRMNEIRMIIPSPSEK
ncbi:MULTISPECIES: lysozyme inhibitor LprI family protein [Pseudescherichia]|uniref:lysozyme inhibitor LprI family protein n=1 Tax=Pseudescherichia TaxID=2055880 RepID=UPI001EDE830C|nr:MULTISPECIES: lysozyme inhibitor LprI family protein [Pseudescherichia]